MSNITTYPNKFNSDSITVDSELLYNFNSLYDIGYSEENETKFIQESKYYTTNIPNDYKNLKFNNIIYTFKGVYLTKYKDILDENNIDNKNNNYNYVLLIECVNYNLDKYLFISLPVYDSENDTTLNEIFKITTDNKNTINNLNNFIPIQEGFYNYKTSGITGKLADVILYTKSNLSIKYNDNVKLNEPTTITNISIPLSISEKPASKVNYITNNSYDNDIYIDCQPVDEPHQDTIVKIITSKSNYQKMFNITFKSIYSLFKVIIPFMIPFIFIFGLLYIILYYKMKL